MIDQLTAAISGNYTVILSLLRILTQGVNAKRDLDVVIDECKFSRSVFCLSQDLNTMRICH